jgi:hypothetical protein
VAATLAYVRRLPANRATGLRGERMGGSFDMDSSGCHDPVAGRPRQDPDGPEVAV